MKTYVVIVTFNGQKWIEICFNSLLNSSIPLNIIVIDNGSSDGTTEIICNNYPSIELIKANKNLGFGKANNIGIKKAYHEGADYIFLLNQDAWIEPDTIDTLISVAKKNPEYGILSPIHLNGVGTAYDYGFFNYITSNKNSNFLFDLYTCEKKGLNDVYQIEFVNAAFWLLPRKTIETVGGFNPFFFHYGEDRDFGIRCIYFKFKVGIVPAVKGYHDRVQHDSIFKKSVMPRTMIFIKFFDPNQPKSINNKIIYIAKLILIKFLQLDFRSAQVHINVIIFVIKNRKKIEQIEEDLHLPGLKYLN